MQKGVYWGGARVETWNYHGTGLIGREASPKLKYIDIIIIITTWILVERSHITD